MPFRVITLTIFCVIPTFLATAATQCALAVVMGIKRPSMLTQTAPIRWTRTWAWLAWAMLVGVACLSYTLASLLLLDRLTLKAL